MPQGIMRKLLQKRAVVGLDLGAGAVKAVEWAQGSVRACSFAPLTEENSSANGPAEAVIRRVLANGARGAGRAVVGLSTDQVLMHAFRLSADLSPAEIEEQARLQAAQAAPYPLADAFYDYRREGAGDRQVNYRMGIVRSTVVDTLCRRVEQAGIKVAAVDLTSFAVQRSLAADAAGGGVWAVLDGGYRATRLSVCRNGGLAFQHSQPFGCRELAERLRAAFGLAANEAHKAIEEWRSSPGTLGAIGNAFLEDLARHAARALQLYLASGRETAVPERVFFWGGAALMDGAGEAVAAALGIPVEAASLTPAPGDASKAPGHAPALLGAYALARNDHA